MTISPEFLNGLFLGGLVAFIVCWIAASQAIKFSDKRYKYVPPKATILHKRDWKKIEKNIAIEIQLSKEEGIKLGREQILMAFENSLQEKKNNLDLRRPYFMLGLKPGAEHMAPARAADMRLRYEDIKKMTEDTAIHELCDFRIQCITRAEEVLTKNRVFQEGGVAI